MSTDFAGFHLFSINLPDLRLTETTRPLLEAKLLEAVVAEVRNAGWRVGNVDATVICERPKLSPHIAEIRKRLSEILFPGEERGVDRISVKGKTNEKMDDVGAGEGIEVHAVALITGER